MGMGRLRDIKSWGDFVEKLFGTEVAFSSARCNGAKSLILLSYR